MAEFYPLALLSLDLLPLALLSSEAPGVNVDPLAELSDTFDGMGSLEERGWSIYDPDGRITTQQINGGELHLQCSGAGAGGLWWYSQIGGPLREEGALIYKEVTGDFDCRLRMRVRNAAGTGSPSAAGFEWRFAGLQAQDPAGLGSTPNYVHIAAGSDPNGEDRIEEKATDDDGSTPQSTFRSDPGAAPLDYDLRMVRTGQLFGLFFRRVDAGETLISDVGWVETSDSPIDRDSNVPPRTGGATPVPMPATLWVGIMPPYGGPQATLDLQCWVEEIVYRTP